MYLTLAVNVENVSRIRANAGDVVIGDACCATTPICHIAFESMINSRSRLFGKNAIHTSFIQEWLL